MADRPTCGQGLAERSTLPLQLGEVIASLADILELHLEALDETDDDALQEHTVYVKLARRHREIAAQLRTAGEEMDAQRELPMGRHDPQALSSPSAVAAFEAFVNAEQDLVGLLQEALEQDQALLVEMRSGEAPA